MALYQLRYGGNIAETDVDITKTFAEGTALALDDVSGKFAPAPSDAAIADGVRFVYTGYISTRPDVQEVAKVKAVFGPAIIETDVISGTVADYDVSDLVAVQTGMIVAGTSDVAIGQVTEKRGSTLVIQIWK